MTEVRHTPTGRLRVCGEDRGGCQCRQIWNVSDDALVAVALCMEDTDYTGGEGYPREKAKANAAEIAHRWNAHAELVAALEVIRTALNDGEGGNYWPARKFLDERGIYNDDLYDLRVLDRVAAAALAAARGEKSLVQDRAEEAYCETGKWPGEK